MKTRRILMLLALGVALLAAIVIVATCRNEELPGELRPGSGSWLPFVHRDLVGMSSFIRIEMGQWSYDSRKIVFGRKETLSTSWLIIGAAPFLGSGGGGEKKMTVKNEVMVYDVSDGTHGPLAEGSFSFLVPGRPVIVYRTSDKVGGRQFHVFNWETGKSIGAGVLCDERPEPSPDGRYLAFFGSQNTLYLAILDQEGILVNLSEKMDPLLRDSAFRSYGTGWGVDGALYVRVNDTSDTYKLNMDDMSFTKMEKYPVFYMPPWIVLAPGVAVKSPDGKYGFRMDRVAKNYTRGKSKAGPIEVNTNIENLTLIGPDGTEKQITDNRIPDVMAPKK